MLSSIHQIIFNLVFPRRLDLFFNEEITHTTLVKILKYKKLRDISEY